MPKIAVDKMQVGIMTLQSGKKWDEWGSGVCGGGELVGHLQLPANVVRPDSCFHPADHRLATTGVFVTHQPGKRHRFCLCDESRYGAECLVYGSSSLACRQLTRRLDTVLGRVGGGTTRVRRLLLR